MFVRIVQLPSRSSPRSGRRRKARGEAANPGEMTQNKFASPRSGRQPMIKIWRDTDDSLEAWVIRIPTSSTTLFFQPGIGVNEVREYIARQKHHHQKISFRDEFIRLSIANEIEFDERYV